MLQQLRTAVIFLGALTLVTGVIYPLVITVIAQTLFPTQARGSLIVKDGKTVGSELIGQSFSRPEYFWSRLSATSPVPYNAAASSGSNFGPLHADITKNARDRIDSLKQASPAITVVPGDLVTSSSSGLDPHISPAAADVQVPRVAAARKISEQVVRGLVEKHTSGRQLGVLGEPRVCVLTLNLALDSLAGGEPR